MQINRIQKCQTGQFHKRSAATTVTVVQFSGMGPDKNYTPGSRGLAVKGASLYHYKLEMGPVNFGGLDAAGRDRKLEVLNDVDTIGTFYLTYRS